MSYFARQWLKTFLASLLVSITIDPFKAIMYDDIDKTVTRIVD